MDRRRSLLRSLGRAGDRSGDGLALGRGLGGDAALGQALLQPGHPGGQPGQGLVQALVAQADEAQLSIRAAVAAAGQVGQGTLEHGERLQQPLGGELFPQGAHGGLVIAAGEQGCAPLGGRLSQQQVPGQGGQLPQNGGHVLPPGIQAGQGI